MLVGTKPTEIGFGMDLQSWGRRLPQFGRQFGGAVSSRVDEQQSVRGDKKKNRDPESERSDQARIGIRPLTIARLRHIVHRAVRRENVPRPFNGARRFEFQPGCD